MTAFTFDVTISSAPPIGSTYVVGYTTQDGTATVGGNDYTAASGTIAFTSNSPTLQQVTVNVTGDTIFEPNETFTVRIADLSGGEFVVVKSIGLGTIFNDDVAGTPVPTPTPSPSPSPTPVTRVEGDVVDASGGPNGDNAVLANDVNIIRQMQLGLIAPPAAGTQFQAADVNLDQNNGCGNAQIDAGDVTVIRGYNLGLFAPKPVCGPTAPTGAKPSLVEATSRIIRAVDVVGFPGQNVTVQFEMDSQGTEASASFASNWNPAVLNYVSTAMGNGVPAGTNLSLNATQRGDGRLGVLLDSTNTFAAGTRQILTMTFAVPANAPGGTYPISFSGSPTAQSISNEQGALLGTTFESGNVVIRSESTVSGRVTTPGGQGIRGARVTISDPNGVQRSFVTGSFGAFVFEGVTPGRNYVLSVTAKRYRFQSRVVSVMDSLSDINFAGLE